MQEMLAASDGQTANSPDLRIPSHNDASIMWLSWASDGQFANALDLCMMTRTDDFDFIVILVNWNSIYEYSYLDAASYVSLCMSAVQNCTNKDAPDMTTVKPQVIQSRTGLRAQNPTETALGSTSVQTPNPLS